MPVPIDVECVVVSAVADRPSLESTTWIADVAASKLRRPDSQPVRGQRLDAERGAA